MKRKGILRPSSYANVVWSKDGDVVVAKETSKNVIGNTKHRDSAVRNNEIENDPSSTTTTMMTLLSRRELLRKDKEWKGLDHNEEEEEEGMEAARLDLFQVLQERKILSSWTPSSCLSHLSSFRLILLEYLLSENKESSSSRSAISLFPPFAILYVVWKSNNTSMPKDPQELVDGVLWRCIKTIQSRTSIALSSSSEQQDSLPTQSQEHPSSSSSNNNNIINNNRVSFQDTTNHPQQAPSDSLKPGKENDYHTDEQELEQQPQEDHTKDQSQSATGENYLEQRKTMKPIPKKKNHHKTSISLYIVVDRIIMTKQNNNNNKPQAEEAEDALADQVVRRAALRLRHLCEGISVFVSHYDSTNTTTATSGRQHSPGLEACLRAISLGHEERKLYGTSTFDTQPTNNLQPTNGNSPLPVNTLVVEEEDDKKVNHQHSNVGIVALCHDDLIPLPSSDTNLPSETMPEYYHCAEWNGRGDLQSFARRAQARWRGDRGIIIIPPQHQQQQAQPELGPRKKKFRTVPKNNSWLDEQALDRAIRRFLYDFGVVVFLIFYLVFHYGRFIGMGERNKHPNK